jgi:hypothetical protein
MTSSPERCGEIPGRPSLFDCLKVAAQYHRELHDGSAARRSSLIKLANNAMRLYDAGLRKGMQWEDGKSPLAVACTAMSTIRRSLTHDQRRDRSTLPYRR